MPPASTPFVAGVSTSPSSLTTGCAVASSSWALSSRSETNCGLSHCSALPSATGHAVPYHHRVRCLCPHIFLCGAVTACVVGAWVSRTLSPTCVVNTCASVGVPRPQHLLTFICRVIHSDWKMLQLSFSIFNSTPLPPPKKKGK